MSTPSVADLRKFAKTYEKKSQSDKLEFYTPFTTDDTHFQDTEKHACEWDHQVELDEVGHDGGTFVADSQACFHESTGRSRWLFGGNRGGKTLPGAAEACLFALGEDGHQFWDGLPADAKKRYSQIETPNEGWVVSRTGDTQKEGTQDWINKLLPDEMIKKVLMKSGDKQRLIELTNGSEIAFKTTDQQREAFQSAAKRWIWFDEEPKSEAIYNECKMRQSGRYPLDIWGTMTPINGMTFLQERIMNNPDEHTIFQWSLWDNPYFPKEQTQQMENEYSLDEVKVRIYGQFSEGSGLIFPMFDEEIHVIETHEVPSNWMILEAFDPGFINKAGGVWWSINPQGDHIICDELYQSGLLINELCGEIHRIRNNPTCSATGLWKPRYSVCDPQVSEPNSQTKYTDREKMASDHPDHGPPVYVQPAKRSSTGIRRIRDWMNPGSDETARNINQTKFFVMEHCRHFIREMKNYRKKPLSGRAEERRNPYEKPMKKDDHLMNCSKYIANENPRYISPNNSGVGSYKDKRTKREPTRRGKKENEYAFS